MKFKILGSGGMYPTPLPNCHCEICESARMVTKKMLDQCLLYI